MARKRPSKSARWCGSSASRHSRDDLRVLLVEDHPLHVRQAVGLEEHVLGAAQADPLRAVLARPPGVGRIVGVRPHLQAAELVGPAQQLHEVGVVEVRHHGLEPVA